MATSPAFQRWLKDVFAKGCDMCHTMSWKVTASGNYICDHCANILPAFVEPEADTNAARAATTTEGEQ